MIDREIDEINRLWHKYFAVVEAELRILQITLEGKG